MRLNINGWTGVKLTMLVLAGLLLSLNLFSQAPQPIFTHYSVEDGLSSSEVHHVLQDAKGICGLLLTWGLADLTVIISKTSPFPKDLQTIPFSISMRTIKEGYGSSLSLESSPFLKMGL